MNPCLASHCDSCACHEIDADCLCECCRPYRRVDLRRDTDLIAQTIERKLMVNDWKIPYTRLSLEACKKILNDELIELNTALATGQDVLGEVTDCIDALMFIAKNTGSLTVDNIVSSEVFWRSRLPAERLAVKKRD